MVKPERFSEIDLEIAQRVYRRNVKPLLTEASTRSVLSVPLNGHHAAVHIEHTPLAKQSEVFANVDVAVSWRYRWCCPHAPSGDEARCHIERSVKHISCVFYGYETYCRLLEVCVLVLLSSSYLIFSIVGFKTAILSPQKATIARSTPCTRSINIVKI